MGSGPAGELVYPDVKARLAAVLAHIAAAELAHEQTAAEVEAERSARTEPEA